MAGGGAGGVLVNACSQGTASDTAPNTLAIQVDMAQAVINKEIFGVLMERLGRGIGDGLFVGTDSSIPNTNGMRNDIIEGFKEAGVGMIQWPGGCAANNYNWSPPNPSNDLGTDRYMELCALLGIEPYLTGRGTADGAESNLEWIQYINENAAHPEWQLKYFKVGNEVWGCGGNQTEVGYRSSYQANYDTLAAPINGKDLTLVAGTGLIGNWTWLDDQLQNKGDVIDGIEIHDYLYFPDSIPCVGFTEDQYYDVAHRANQGQIGPRIDEIRGILDEHDPENRIKIFLDEWGDWLIGFNETDDTWLQQVTVMDAISSAEQLHLFMRNADRIFMAAVAQPINVIHSLFLTHPDDGTLVKTPAFYVFKMFVPHHTSGAQWAPHTLESEDVTGNGNTFPVLSAGTSVDSSGRVNISLVNVDLVNPRTIDVAVSGGASSYIAATAQVITGPDKDSYNDFGQEEVVNIQALPSAECTTSGASLRVVLPAKSVVMVSLVPQ
jgi:alpha-L-arabinofuranosidase